MLKIKQNINFLLNVLLMSFNKGSQYRLNISGMLVRTLNYRFPLKYGRI